MEGVLEFLSMGGYGGYVWSAYLIAAVVLLALLVASLRGVRGQEARLADLRRAYRGPVEDDSA